MGNVRVQTDQEQRSVSGTEVGYSGLKGDTETHSYRYTRTAALPLWTVTDLAWSTSYPRPTCPFQWWKRRPSCIYPVTGGEMRGAEPRNCARESYSLQVWAAGPASPCFLAMSVPLTNVPVLEFYPGGKVWWKHRVL